MFVFISYKTIKIRVNSTKCRLMINFIVEPVIFRNISTTENGNYPLISFSLVNFILACFVFKYLLKFEGGDRNRTNISSTYLL